jgi:hypothetical protein
LIEERVNDSGEFVGSFLEATGNERVHDRVVVIESNLGARRIILEARVFVSRAVALWEDLHKMQSIACFQKIVDGLLDEHHEAEFIGHDTVDVVAVTAVQVAAKLSALENMAAGVALVKVFAGHKIVKNIILESPASSRRQRFDGRSVMRKALEHLMEQGGFASPARAHKYDDRVFLHTLYEYHFAT